MIRLVFLPRMSWLLPVACVMLMSASPTLHLMAPGDRVVVVIAPVMVASETQVSIRADGSVRVCFDAPPGPARKPGHFTDCEDGNLSSTQLETLRRGLQDPIFAQDASLDLPVADGAMVIIQVTAGAATRTVRMQPFMREQNPGFTTVMDVVLAASHRFVAERTLGRP